MNLFATACSIFCLVINTVKTVLIHQPPPKAAYNTSHTDVNDAKVQATGTLAYRGSMLSQLTQRRRDKARRYKDTLKTSMEDLQINPPNWNDPARDRPAYRRAAKTGAAIYEATHITAVKAKCEAQKSQLSPPDTANNQSFQTRQRFHERCEHQSVLLGIFETTVAPGRPLSRPLSIINLSQCSIPSVAVLQHLPRLTICCDGSCPHHQ
nr:unnamed protein product [Spirometra erinaceieuropaei]